MINFLQTATESISYNWNSVIEMAYKINAGPSLVEKIGFHAMLWFASGFFAFLAAGEMAYRFVFVIPTTIILLPILLCDLFIGTNYSKVIGNFILKNLLGGAGASLCATGFHILNLVSGAWAGSFIARQIFEDPSIPPLPHG